MNTTTKPKKKTKNSANYKVFLANPFKPKCPSLEDSDLEELRQKLLKAIEESKMTPRIFATTSHISIGLESSLRAINAGKAGCVFLSKSIKPQYLLGLISRNVTVKNETTPTFAQSQLEEFTKQIFGISSLALVLPKDVNPLGCDLYKWVQTHQTLPQRRPVKKQQLNTKNSKIKPTSASTVNTMKNLSVSNFNADQEETPIKPWGSSYISFTEAHTAMDVDEVNTKQDEDNLANVLEKIAKKAKEQTTSDQAKEMQLTDSPRISDTKVEDIEKDDNEDDFLNEYMPLTVHKICPNPNRKPRKKRKKNK